VIIISIWQQIFGGDGFFTHLVVGLGGKPLNLMSNPALFQPMVILQVMWKESGWSTIMFLAAITSIDMSLYEAAAVDGASKWGRLWHVTLPGMRSIIFLLLILRLGSVLTIGFEQIFLLRSGFSTNVAEVIDTFVYSRGILSGQWGFAAAVALLKAAIGALLIYVSNRVAKKLGEEGLY
jgi:putative aldouronate transport system permease protein